MINQHLLQKQLQKLSPQQIQLMKLLQVPTSEFDQRIEEEIEANPALEHSRTDEDYDSEDQPNQTIDDSLPFDSSDDDDSANVTEPDDFLNETPETFELDVAQNDDDSYIENYLNDDDVIANYKLQGDSNTNDTENTFTPVAIENSLHEYLGEQLNLLDLDERSFVIAKQIIGSVDEDGYLRRPLISISDDLVFSQNLNTEELEIEVILKKIQTLDPAGIGARSLRECLLIQLKRNYAAATEPAQKQVLKYSIDLITNHFGEFTKKHYDKLQRQLGINHEELKQCILCIISLNPKPASGYTPSNSNEHKVQYIIPDFLVDNIGNNQLELSLNSKNAPDLRISEQFSDLLRTYTETNGKDKKNRDAIQFIKQKIDSAKWFIDAIKQRQNTMYNTMYAIMSFQFEYFLTGDDRTLKPMILKDIAEITKLDISTVSRVANSKYVQTEFGMKQLKEFFSEALQTESGEEVSTIEVKDIIHELILNEHKKKPLSDEKIKEILTLKGYNIARRTVAKYREQLNVPVARLRREL